MPPVSPWPARRRSPSMSAWRKSWATVNPSPWARPASGDRRWSRSERASRATPASGPSVRPTASRTVATWGSNGSAWSPSAARAAARAAGSSRSSAATSSSMRVVTTPGTSPSVSASRPRAPSSVAYGRAATSASRTGAGSWAANDSSVAWARRAGEATVEDQLDQDRQGREDRGSRPQGPRRVLPEERALLVQQRRQSLPRRRPRDGGQRVDGRDGGKRVRPVRGREVQVPDQCRRVTGGRSDDDVRREAIVSSRVARETVAPDPLGVNRLAHAHGLALRCRRKGTSDAPTRIPTDSPARMRSSGPTLIRTAAAYGSGRPLRWFGARPAARRST